MPRIVFLYIALLACAYTMAQTPTYIHYTVDDGLPSNLVYCALQDKKGIMWFGTDKGLVRFDNREFRTYGVADGLPDPDVLNIWEDMDGNLWVSCFRRKPCYIKQGKVVNSGIDKRLEQIELETGICNFYQNSSKSIWLLGAGLKGYVINENKVSAFKTIDAILKIKLYKGTYYGLAASSVLKSKDGTTFETIYKFNHDKYQNPNFSIESIGDRFLYSFRKHTVLLGLREGKITSLDSIAGLSGICSIDRDGRFWLNSPASGSICFLSRENLLNRRTYLNGKKVCFTYEDTLGALWFCTLDDGIYVLPPKYPTVFDDPLLKDNIQSVSRRSNGEIMVGDNSGNLVYLCRISHKIQAFSSFDGYNRIISIMPDVKGYDWIVTDEGIFVSSGYKNQHKLAELGSPKAICRDGDSIWCGTSARLTIFSVNTFDTLFSLERRVTALGIDAERNVWSGGIEGLYSSKDTFRYNWGEAFPSLRSRIVSIATGEPGYIWVVTPDQGLLRVRVKGGGVTETVPANNLLQRPIKNIQSLYRAENGYLWLATNRGVYGLDPQTWRVQHFNRHNGLSSDDVRSVVVYKDTLWAGTAAGITRLVLPSGADRIAFPTYITEIRYQQGQELINYSVIDSIAPEKEIELPADATLVAVGFTGLDYRNRGNLFFQCITTYLPPPLAYWTVDNLVSWSYHYFDVHSDTSWVYKPGLEYGVHLPPGRYKLKITAYTTPENPSTHPATCLLLMQPHWYNTVWFYLGGWILLASMLYRIISAREQLRKLNIALTRTKFIALQAQINPHFMGNAVNAIHRFFYPPNPGIASRYTAIFTRMLRQTLHFSETTFIPFEKEIAYCKDYLELSRLRLGNDKFKYEIRGIKSIPEDLPFPSLFLQPILENATLHGLATVGVSYVCVAFYRRNGRVICTITDNGPGFRATSEEQKEERPAYHVSKGLTLLYSKVDALNQLYDLGMQIRISDYEEDNPAGIGTRVKVTFLEAKALKATRRHRWYKLSVLI